MNRIAKDPQLGQPTNLWIRIGSPRLCHRVSRALAMVLEVVGSIDLVGRKHLVGKMVVLLTSMLLRNPLDYRKAEVEVEFDTPSCLAPGWLLERHL